MKFFGLVLITILCLFYVNSNAQQFGVIGGASFSKMTATNSSNIYNLNSGENKFILGQHIGVNFSVPLSNKFTFEPALIYSNKGSEFIGNYPNNPYAFNIKQTIKLHYIEIPLLLKMGLDIGKFNVYGITGPYLGRAISGKIKTEYLGADNIGQYDQTKNIDWNNNSYNRMDIGMSYGLGVAYNSFQLKTMYLDGLTKVIGTAKNKEIRLSLLYMLKNKKKEAIKSNSENNENGKSNTNNDKKIFQLGLMSGVNFDQMGNPEPKGRGLDASYEHFYRHNFIGKHIGVILKMRIKKGISIQSSILYSTKESTLESSYSGSSTGDYLSGQENRKVQLSYIDIPINLNLNYNIGQIELYFSLGPYLASGISGTYQYNSSSTYINNGPQPAEETITTSVYDGKIRWGASQLEDKQFDYGFNYGIGIEFKSFQLSGKHNINLGIGDNRDYRNTLKNNLFQVSLAYFFINKRKDKN